MGAYFWELARSAEVGAAQTPVSCTKCTLWLISSLGWMADWIALAGCAGKAGVLAAFGACAVRGRVSGICLSAAGSLCTARFFFKERGPFWSD